MCDCNEGTSFLHATALMREVGIYSLARAGVEMRIIYKHKMFKIAPLVS